MMLLYYVSLYACVFLVCVCAVRKAPTFHFFTTSHQKVHIFSLKGADRFKLAATRMLRLHSQKVSFSAALFSTV